MEASKVAKLIKSAPLISKRLHINKLRYIRSKQFAYLLAGFSLVYPVARIFDSKNILGLGTRAPLCEDHFKAQPDFLTGKITISKNSRPAYNPYI